MLTCVFKEQVKDLQKELKDKCCIEKK